MAKGHLLIFALVCTSLQAQANIGASSSTEENITVDSMQYVIVDSTATATLHRYDKGGDTAVIPATIEYKGKTYQVVAINNDRNRVFYGTHNNIRKVSLPEGLKRVGNYAFYYCSNLEEITIPSTVEYIGNLAFSNTGLKRLELKPISAPKLGEDTFYGSNDLKSINIPEGSLENYKGEEGWIKYILVPGDGITLDIDLKTPGELGNEILKLTKDLSDVNVLKVKGKLNDDDLYNIKNRLTSLLSLDLSEVDLEYLPDKFLYENRAIRNVVLPANLQTIGRSAFYGCNSLEEIVVPASVKTIRDYAFYNCTHLKKATLQEGLTSIESSAFQYCSSLMEITLPASLKETQSDIFRGATSLKKATFLGGLKTIESSTFYGCYSLEQVNLHTGLRHIESYAFYECHSLKSLDLPSTLITIKGYAFHECNSLEAVTLPQGITLAPDAFRECKNLKTVTCLAIVPPDVSNNNPFQGGMDMDQRTLYVPAICINNYKQSQGWDAFPHIEPLDTLPSEMVVYKKFQLDLPDELPATYKPTVMISASEGKAGNLTVKGNGTLSMSRFSISYNPQYYINGSSDESYNIHGTLVNEAKMRADKLTTRLYVSKDRWNFISLPYDVKVSDIQCADTAAQWVIRKYSGEHRAKGDKDNTWLNMTADSTLHAHEGYILQCSNSNTGYYSPVLFYFDAVNNASKNDIFAATDQKLPLKEYVAEFAHNRSWNLIGNPYPAYFDTRYLDFTAPITVWNLYSQNYQAYSPVDDSYILWPGEAFFVQRPVDQAELTFAAEGRQHDRKVRSIEQTQARTTPALAAARTASDKLGTASRQVYNLLLTGDASNDRTRVVINEQAELNYNAAHDAAKLMSDNTLSAQLYTIGNDADYAINERPLADGNVMLGARFAKTGDYTLSLGESNTATGSVTLIDRQEGKQVELNAAGYRFTAKAGDERNRFSLVFGKGTTGIDTINAADAAGQSLSVSAQGGTISVSTTADAISLYTADGKLVGTAIGGKAQWNVKAGTYIVRAGKESRKVTL